MKVEVLKTGGELGDQFRTGDNTRSVTLSGLHLSFSGIRKPKRSLGMYMDK